MPGNVECLRMVGWPESALQKAMEMMESQRFVLESIYIYHEYTRYTSMWTGFMRLFHNGHFKHTNDRCLLTRGSQTDAAGYVLMVDYIRTNDLNEMKLFKFLPSSNVVRQGLI